MGKRKVKKKTRKSARGRSITAAPNVSNKYHYVQAPMDLGTWAMQQFRADMMAQRLNDQRRMDRIRAEQGVLGSNEYKTELKKTAESGEKARLAERQASNTRRQVDAEAESEALKSGDAATGEHRTQLSRLEIANQILGHLNSQQMEALQKNATAQQLTQSLLEVESKIAQNIADFAKDHPHLKMSPNPRDLDYNLRQLTKNMKVYGQIYTNIQNRMGVVDTVEGLCDRMNGLMNSYTSPAWKKWFSELADIVLFTEGAHEAIEYMDKFSDRFDEGFDAVEGRLPQSLERLIRAERDAKLADVEAWATQLGAREEELRNIRARIELKAAQLDRLSECIEERADGNGNLTEDDLANAYRDFREDVPEDLIVPNMHQLDLQMGLGRTEIVPTAGTVSGEKQARSEFRADDSSSEELIPPVPKTYAETATNTVPEVPSRRLVISGDAHANADVWSVERPDSMGFSTEFHTDIDNRRKNKTTTHDIAVVEAAVDPESGDYIGTERNQQIQILRALKVPPQPYKYKGYEFDLSLPHDRELLRKAKQKEAMFQQQAKVDPADFDRPWGDIQHAPDVDEKKEPEKAEPQPALLPSQLPVGYKFRREGARNFGPEDDNPQVEPVIHQDDFRIEGLNGEPVENAIFSREKQYVFLPYYDPVDGTWTDEKLGKAVPSHKFYLHGAPVSAYDDVKEEWVTVGTFNPDKDLGMAYRRFDIEDQLGEKSDNKRSYISEHEFVRWQQRDISRRDEIMRQWAEDLQEYKERRAALEARTREIAIERIDERHRNDRSAFIKVVDYRKLRQWHADYDHRKNPEYIPPEAYVLVRQRDLDE